VPSIIQNAYAISKPFFGLHRQNQIILLSFPHY
jgi:hypothetical protein